MSDEEGDESEEEEQKGPKWPTSVSIAEGKLHFRMGSYQKAINCFNSVLEREPKNVKILNARSQCFYRLMDYDRATKDIEEAIKLDPRRVQSLCQKGEIEYTEGDFEYAYLTFQKGHVNRPNYDGFRFGLQKCKDAILKAIGPESGLKLTDDDVKMVEKRLKEARQKHFSNRKDLKKIDDDKSVQLSEVESKKILREMSEDKAFFKSLLNDKRLRQSISDEGKAVQNSCRKALDFLKGRQSFWQMERPQRSRVKPISSIKVLSKSRKPNTDKDNMRSVEYVDEASTSLAGGCPRETLEACNKALKLTSSTEFEQMSKVFELMGWAHADMGDLDSAIHCHGKQKMIAENLSSAAVCRALRNLGEDYVRKDDLQNALVVYQEILSSSDEDCDIGGAFGEICKCQLQLNNLDEARETGKQALTIAKRISYIDLELDVCFTMGKIEEADGKFKRAIHYMNRSRQLATITGNNDLAQEAQDMVEALKLQLAETLENSNGNIGDEEDYEIRSSAAANVEGD